MQPRRRNMAAYACRGAAHISDAAAEPIQSEHFGGTVVDFLKLSFLNVVFTPFFR